MEITNPLYGRSSLAWPHQHLFFKNTLHEQALFNGQLMYPAKENNNKLKINSQFIKKELYEKGCSSKSATGFNNLIDSLEFVTGNLVYVVMAVPLACINRHKNVSKLVRDYARKITLLSYLNQTYRRHYIEAVQGFHMIPYKQVKKKNMTKSVFIT